MKVHLLSGFLGSGKTTAIDSAWAYLTGHGKSVGVIANDQGTHLVDGAFFNQRNIATRQVLKGCFCCKYKDFEQQIDSLNRINSPDVIFAESVGSCTDIVATVVKPLLKYTGNKSISLSTFADIRLLKMLLDDERAVFDDTVRYIYFKQLEEASVMVVTKIDLVSGQVLKEVKKMINERYNDKIVLYQNSMDSSHIGAWLAALDRAADSSFLRSLKIDYDTYGEGESRLAWFDQQVEIYNTDDAAACSFKLIRVICEEIAEAGYPVGHLKFFVDDKIKISFTTLWDLQSLDKLKPEKKSYIKLLINARIQTHPESLSALMNRAVQKVRDLKGCLVLIKNTASFRPGIPKPVHRIVEQV